jgi:hypothetical protein
MFLKLVYPTIEIGDRNFEVNTFQDDAITRLVNSRFPDPHRIMATAFHALNFLAD